jgi:hypothetical protein
MKRQKCKRLSSSNKAPNGSHNSKTLLDSYKTQSGFLFNCPVLSKSFNKLLNAPLKTKCRASTSNTLHLVENLQRS